MKTALLLLLLLGPLGCGGDTDSGGATPPAPATDVASTGTDAADGSLPGDTSPASDGVAPADAVGPAGSDAAGDAAGPPDDLGAPPDAAPDGAVAPADAADATPVDATPVDATPVDATPVDATDDTAGDTTAPPDTTPSDPAACNGKPEYCARPYNQVAQVCTHNAMSSVADGFLIPLPNQEHGLTRQLDDGVRCLMLDTYEDQGELALCHAICGPWGRRPLVDALVEIRQWMDAHPREVVTFILEAYITEAQTHQALVDAGLADAGGAPTAADPLYFHDAPPGSPWPTLGWMVENDQRLVVFTDDSKANGAWHLHWPSYGWETPYNDPTFTCADGRGDPTAYDDQIFILNHYTLCEFGGCAENGVVNNALPFVYERAVGCWQVSPQDNPWGQIPTFVNVDHYEVPAPGAGDARADIFEAVEALNAAWPGPPPPASP